MSSSWETAPLHSVVKLQLNVITPRAPALQLHLAVLLLLL
jgi:hypothetical protein